MPVVVSLFDESGLMVRDWAYAGAHCYCFDKDYNDNRVEYVGNRGGYIQFVNADLLLPEVRLWIVHTLRPRILFGFPPCTDLAVSGAKHFESKLLDNPNVFDEAMRLVWITPDLGDELGIPYLFENPVSIISTIYGPPDFYFDPCDYGGYLPLDDVHPLYPEYILPRDAYTKKTCGWTNDKFVVPVKRPVEPVVIEYDNGKRGSPMWAKLGGKSAKTKRIRSTTPRGFARAVFMANGWQIFA